ncbi:MAG: hypothetical protein ACN6I5_00970 [Hyphomicrobiales bacterium]
MSRQTDRRLHGPRCKPLGRLVAHAVTLESEAVLQCGLWPSSPANLQRISVETRVEPVGPFERLEAGRCRSRNSRRETAMTRSP